MTLTGQAKRDYQKKWLAERRDEWIESQGGACAVCGSSANLEVDHIDRTTKLCNPTAIWSRNKNFREAELDKCQVLCNDCHSKKTVVELTIDHPHGTYARYKKGCKCGSCKESVAPYWRDYRERKLNIGH